MRRQHSQERHFFLSNIKRGVAPIEVEVKLGKKKWLHGPVRKEYKNTISSMKRLSLKFELKINQEL